MGQDERDDQPKGFLEEVFDHRQVRPQPVDEPADVEPTLSLDDAVLPADAIADTTADEPEPVLTTDQTEVDAGVVELDAMDRALVDEAMKKSGIVWIGAGGGLTSRAAWYVWLDGAAYVLTGAGEQPGDDLADGATVRVSARSKETRAAVVEWVGRSTHVVATDPDWEEVAAALAKARLNLSDPATAPDRWAADPAIALYRIVPTGPLVEAPGRYSDASRRAMPVPSPAVTAGPPPKVIHRRQTARRPLS